MCTMSLLCLHAGLPLPCSSARHCKCCMCCSMPRGGEWWQPLLHRPCSAVQSVGSPGGGPPPISPFAIPNSRRAALMASPAPRPPIASTRADPDAASGHFAVPPPPTRRERGPGSATKAALGGRQAASFTQQLRQLQVPSSGLVREAALLELLTHYTRSLPPVPGASVLVILFVLSV